MAVYVWEGNENVIVDDVYPLTVTGIVPSVPVHPTIRSLGTGDFGSSVTVNSIALSFTGDPFEEPNCKYDPLGNVNVTPVDVYVLTFRGMSRVFTSQSV